MFNMPVQKCKSYIFGKIWNHKNLLAPNMIKHTYFNHFSLGVYLLIIIEMFWELLIMSYFQMNSFMKKRSLKPSLTNLTKPLLKCRVTKNPLKCGVIVNCPKFYLFPPFWYSHSFMQNCPLKTMTICILTPT